MLRQQFKAAKNVKNQGHIGPPKEHNNFPITDPREVEIPDLLNKEFKTALLRKLNEVKENTER